MKAGFENPALPGHYDRVDVGFRPRLPPYRFTTIA